VLGELAADAFHSAVNALEGARKQLTGASALEEHLREAAAALHRSADAMEHHVAVLEGLATTLPALADAVTKLSEQLAEVLHLAAPVEAVEREVSGLGHLLHRHHQQEPPAGG
jgi:hypothetical protein